ncbi:LOW QUALITY PROTEIN: acetylcholinesterase-like [Sceloporus undulatus]|uniref:LOW QUALITY PROTEIN: acetylcholinesterase-like n=1 Tax=Sceloporus undulatus TaxID=8520 RepID=UPI001C4D725E|nr:LOW QUALITY PROTEIN: acetylcholinesterase-like [Sceloporus undulatus]
MDTLRVVIALPSSTYEEFSSPISQLCIYPFGLNCEGGKTQEPWSQVLEATNFGHACPQIILSDLPDADKWAANRPLSEDCLFLNIWAPHPQPSTPAPVLVWIHGGGYYFIGTGSLDFYNGASLAATENVIVVSMNYRLGALGFLYLPPAVPGNMGLWDQQLALTWVKENAAAFGGDPNRVTILGHSAGAASVGFHLLSPKSESLFAHAVLQSGAPNAIWAWSSPDEVKQKSLLFSKLMGCKEGNESEIVTCLQGKTTEFPQNEASIHTVSNVPVAPPFSPTIDGDFLPDDPQKLLEMGRIQIKPTLIGFTSDEGSIFTLLLFPGTNRSLISLKLFQTVIQLALQNVTDAAAQAIALKYAEDIDIPVLNFSSLSQALGDSLFVCPAAQFAAKSREAGSPVYTYSFSHRTPGSLWPEWAGAPHGTEVPYMFGTLDSALGVNQTCREAEAELSHRVMRYWAEFARSGNPTGPEVSEVAWPLYNATQQNFFHLGTEPSEVLQISPARHCDLLKRLSGNPKIKEEESTFPGKEKDGVSSLQQQESP